MIDHRDTILAQYANSPTIVDLIDRFNEWIDPQADILNFYNTIWNVETANDHGLDIWGRIVNVSRYLKVLTPPTYFGFMEAYTAPTEETGVQPLNQAPMYTGESVTTTYRLETEAFRKLILLKAMSNITNCTVPSLNAMLKYFFSGRSYVHDTGDMQLRYVFEFDLSPFELAIMLNSGAIPRPAGVLANVMQVNPSATFGFFEAGGQPFNQGSFFNSQGLQYAS